MVVLEPDSEQLGHGRIFEVGKGFDVIAIEVVLEHIVDDLGPPDRLFHLSKGWAK